MKKISPNLTVTDTADVRAGVVLDAVASVTILPAQATDDQPRTLITICNLGIQDAFVKKQAASVDNVVKGICIPRGTSMVVMEAPNVYTGEWSGITSMGTTTVFLTVE